MEKKRVGLFLFYIAGQQSSYHWADRITITECGALILYGHIDFHDDMLMVIAPGHWRAAYRVDESNMQEAISFHMAGI